MDKEQRAVHRQFLQRHVRRPQKRLLRNRKWLDFVGTVSEEIYTVGRRADIED